MNHLKRIRPLFLILLPVLMVGILGCPPAQDRVTVPNVLNMQEVDAVAAIEAAGLVAGNVTEDYSNDTPLGGVIAQVPAAGASVNPNTSVNLLVSVGILLNDEVPVDFVRIPAGTYMMGRFENEQDSEDTESPRRQVTIGQEFWMSKYPITQAQWQAVMGDNPSFYSGANRPVERVSWNDIRSQGGFLDELNAMYAGLTFRLPTEAEWEYAYRAGTTSRFYWGNDPSYNNIGDYAWYQGNSTLQTHDVGQKTPNAWGLHDMAGNVLEWCEDDWHENYEGAPTDGSARIDEPRGSARVVRGGGWPSSAPFCRAASRTYDSPDESNFSIGFRIVLP